MDRLDSDAVRCLALTVVSYGWSLVIVMFNSKPLGLYMQYMLDEVFSHTVLEKLAVKKSMSRVRTHTDTFTCTPSPTAAVCDMKP